MKKKTLQKNIIFVTVLPMILLGTILFAVTYSHFKKTMTEQVKIELMDVAVSAASALDYAFPGDYVAFGDDSMVLLKGETTLNDRFEYIDQVKLKTGLDISIFFDNIRFLTTILNEKNQRILGTYCNDRVKTDVYNTGNSQFYDSVIVGDENYFAYYYPVKNSNGMTVGMIGVAKPSEVVRKENLNAMLPVLIIGTITIVLMGVIMFQYGQRLSKDILKLNKFLGEVSKGNLQARIDNSLIKSGDEISQMGQSALIMQKELRKLIEQDPLTCLNNRRSAAKHIARLIKEFDTTNEPFSIALGDIDFFKKVNDTYGHDAGDEVLKMVASKLTEGVPAKSFVARWGGEEFLLGFSGMDVSKTKETLEKILNSIRETTVFAEGVEIKVTMSFGVAEGKMASQDELVKAADDLLYYAKEHGRNRIICEKSDTK